MYIVYIWFHNICIIQNSIKIEKWIKERVLKVSQEKTIAMKCKYKKDAEPNLTLEYSQEIKVAESTRYLGHLWQTINMERTCWKSAMNLINPLSHLL